MEKEQNCEHKWIIIDENWEVRIFGPSTKKYILQCEKCGDIKSETV